MGTCLTLKKNMYKILVVCALSWELKLIKKKIKNVNIYWINIDFFTTWMWNYNTILNLTKFLEKNDYDFVLNIWSSWYFKLKNFNNIYLINRIFNLSNNKELLTPILFDNIFEFASVYCDEKPIKEVKFNDLNDNVLLDMESFGFETVMNSFKIPRVLLKIPVDKVWEEFDKKVFENNVNNINYNQILKKIKNYLWNQQKDKNLQFFYDYFYFTFTEKQIFKKLYFKYKALLSNDFMCFFDENKNLDKKTFLKKLKNIE